MKENTTSPQRRTIRSFVKREGRLTPGQQRALNTLWPEFGLSLPASPYDLTEIFQREAPKILEIGFGSGRSLAEMAQANPDIDYLGVEVHRPGVGSLLLQIEQQGLTNLRVLSADIMAVLRDALPASALSGVFILFPDPWPKKRHHKRRLIQKEFIEQLSSRLKPGGFLQIATDWADYAEHIEEIMAQQTALKAQPTAPRQDRVMTKYEQRGLRLGHQVWEQRYCLT